MIDHMCILFTKPSLVIPSQTCYFYKRPKGTHNVHLSTMCYLFDGSARVVIFVYWSAKKPCWNQNFSIHLFNFNKIALNQSFRNNFAAMILFRKRRILNQCQILNITTQSVASPRTPHLLKIPIMTFTFERWPPKSIGFTMVNMSAKFDKEAHNGLVCIRFTAFSHTSPLWPWRLTSKINRVHPLTMVNMSAKFDKEINNGLVSIMFTSLFPYMSIVTLTFDLWPPKSKGFILSTWLKCLPSLIKKHTSV